MSVWPRQNTAVCVTCFDVLPNTLIVNSSHMALSDWRVACFISCRSVWMVYWSTVNSAMFVPTSARCVCVWCECDILLYDDRTEQCIIYSYLFIFGRVIVIVWKLSLCTDDVLVCYHWWRVTRDAVRHLVNFLINLQWRRGEGGVRGVRGGAVTLGGHLQGCGTLTRLSNFFHASTLR